MPTTIVFNYYMYSIVHNDFEGINEKAHVQQKQENFLRSIEFSNLWVTNELQYMFYQIET